MKENGGVSTEERLGAAIIKLSMPPVIFTSTVVRIPDSYQTQRSGI